MSSIAKALCQKSDILRTMIKTPWQTSVYVRLLRLYRKGFLQSHLACLAAGFLLLAGVHPAGLPKKPTSLSSLLGGVFLLMAFFALSAPFLNALQPLFLAAGQLGARALFSLALGAIFVWRYIAGRRLLRALAQG